MKILVLGGGGFLGSHLCDKLLSLGHEVRVFERPHIEKYRNFQSTERIEWFEGDFINDKDLGHALSGCDYIFHLVSTTLPKSSNDNPVYDVETNIVGTLNLLNHARSQNVKKIIFLSSGGTVYGIPENVPIKENDPTNPICSYGITKLTIERYLHLYHSLYGLDYCVLRLSNPFGERQRVQSSQGVVTVFLDKVFNEETIEIWGDGSIVRDYIYVSDAVDAMIKAIAHDGDDRVFNIGSGKGQSLNDILTQIVAVTNLTPSIEFLPGRKLDVPVNVLDIELAERKLGWKPSTAFKLGLERTLAWLEGESHTSHEG